MAGCQSCACAGDAVRCALPWPGPDPRYGAAPSHAAPIDRNPYHYSQNTHSHYPGYRPDGLLNTTEADANLFGARQQPYQQGQGHMVASSSAGPSSYIAMQPSGSAQASASTSARVSGEAGQSFLPGSSSNSSLARQRTPPQLSQSQELHPGPSPSKGPPFSAQSPHRHPRAIPFPNQGFGSAAGGIRPGSIVRYDALTQVYDAAPSPRHYERLQSPHEPGQASVGSSAGAGPGPSYSLEPPPELRASGREFEHATRHDMDFHRTGLPHASRPENEGEASGAAASQPTMRQRLSAEESDAQYARARGYKGFPRIAGQAAYESSGEFMVETPPSSGRSSGFKGRNSPNLFSAFRAPGSGKGSTQRTSSDKASSDLDEEQRRRAYAAEYGESDGEAAEWTIGGAPQHDVGEKSKGAAWLQRIKGKNAAQQSQSTRMSHSALGHDRSQSDHVASDLHASQRMTGSQGSAMSHERASSIADESLRPTPEVSEYHHDASKESGIGGLFRRGSKGFMRRPRDRPASVDAGAEGLRRRVSDSRAHTKTREEHGWDESEASAGKKGWFGLGGREMMQSKSQQDASAGPPGDAHSISARISESSLTMQETPQPLTRCLPTSGWLCAHAFTPDEWSGAYELAQAISYSESDSKEAARVLRKEFKTGTPEVQKRAARLLAILTLHASDRFKLQVATKRFLEVLEDILKSKHSPPPLVQDALLNVISGLAFQYRHDAELSAFTKLWNKVKPIAAPTDGIPIDPRTDEFRPPFAWPSNAVSGRAETKELLPEMPSLSDPVRNTSAVPAQNGLARSGALMEPHRQPREFEDHIQPTQAAMFRPPPDEPFMARSRSSDALRLQPVAVASDGEQQRHSIQQMPQSYRGGPRPFPGQVLSPSANGSDPALPAGQLPRNIDDGREAAPAPPAQSTNTITTNTTADEYFTQPPERTGSPASSIIMTPIVPSEKALGKRRAISVHEGESRANGPVDLHLTL